MKFDSEHPNTSTPVSGDEGGSLILRLWRRVHAIWNSGPRQKWLLVGEAVALLAVLCLLLLLVFNLLKPSSPPPGPRTFPPPLQSAPDGSPSTDDQNSDKKEDPAAGSAQPPPTSATPTKKKSGGKAGGGTAGGGSSGGSAGGTIPISCEVPYFPSATCTGPQGNLPLYIGSTDFRTDGEVIENVEIRINQGLNIAANNVTFRNVRVVFTGFRGEDFTMANVTSGTTGTVFENCEFDGQTNVERAISGVGTDTTVRKCNIHHTANGVEVSSPLLVEESYIHDIFSPVGTGWHADGIQVSRGGDDITIRHNTVILTGGETGAISVEGSTDGLDPAENVLIENNLLGGGSWTLYVGPGSNFRVLNNRFTTQIWPRTAQFGIWTNFNGDFSSLVRSGNAIYETGVSANDNNW